MDLGTIIPENNTILLKSISRKIKPEFSPRETWLLNHSDVPEVNWSKWARRTRHGGFYMSMGHSFWGLKKHFPNLDKDHPEYFAIDKQGNRKGFNDNSPKYTHMCFTAPGVEKVFIEVIKDYFKESKSHRCFTIMQGDGFRGNCCQCKNCKKLYDFGSNLPNRMQSSRYIWGFTNKIAKEIGKEFPDRMILCCSYGSYAYPHPDIKYEPNVAVACTANKVGFGSQTGKSLEKIDKWKGIVDNIYLDENYHRGLMAATKEDRTRLGGIQGAPQVCPRRIAEEIKLSRGKIKGQPYDVTESLKSIRRFDSKHNSKIPFYKYWVMDIINLYIESELIFDAALEINTLVDRYCKDLYGPGAEEIKAFYTLLEDRWLNTPAELGITDYKQINENIKYRDDIPGVMWKHVYPPDIIKRLFLYIEKAKQKALKSDDSRYLERLEFLEKGFERMRIDSEKYIEKMKSRANFLVSNIIAEKVKDKSIKIDGILNEKEWLESLAGKDFTDISTKEKASKQTKFRVLFDDRYFYIGAECEESDIKDIEPTKYERDGRVWDDNSVEIFLAKAAEGEEWYQFIAGVGESKFDSRNKKAEWNPTPDWLAAGKLNEKSWTLEAAIPFEALGLEEAPGKGVKWKIKICRTSKTQKGIISTVWGDWWRNSYMSPIKEYGNLWFEERGDMIVVNPSFETASHDKSWPVMGWRIQHEQWSLENPHTGKRCLKLDGKYAIEKKGKISVKAWAGCFPLKENTEYQFSVWIRVPDPIKGHFTASLCFMDENGKYLPGGKKSKIALRAKKGFSTDGWVKIERIKTTIPGTNKGYIMFQYGASEGVVFLDDVEVIKLKEN